MKPGIYVYLMPACTDEMMCLPINGSKCPITCLVTLQLGVKFRESPQLDHVQHSPF